MFLPLSDMPNPRGVPVVNYLLIGANVAVYLLVTLPLSLARPDLSDPAVLHYVTSIPAYRNVPLTYLAARLSAYDLFVFAHGFKPAHPSVADLLASMFLHSGLLHLAGNMLFLWIYGDNVEHRLGSWLYLPVYLATGAAATLFYSLFQMHSTIPMIGASGAISGVLGLYFVWFPRNKVRVMLMLFPFFWDVILLPARWVLGFFVVLDNLIPFLLAPSRSGGVAYGAHLGGFLAGVLLARGLDRWPEIAVRRRLGRAAARPADPSEIALPLAERIHRALLRDDPEAAAAAYFAGASASARREVSGADRIRIGYYLLEQGRYREALTCFRQYIADHPAGPLLDRALLGAGRALYQGMGQLTAAYQYFLAVLDLDPDPEAAAEARRYLAAIEQLQKLRFSRE